MKLVSLNTWGATQGQQFFDYIKDQAKDTDIFCFQEIFSSLPGSPQTSSGGRMFLFQELSLMLNDFCGFFMPRSTGFHFGGPADFPVSHGLAIFARKKYPVLSYRSEIIEQTDSKEDPVEGWTKAQVLTIEYGGKNVCVVNYHGVAQPGHKQDTPARLEHSKKLALIWDSLGEAGKILCGDFNMYPEIESIKILEQKGRNLIKEFKIQNTRNEISWEKYPNNKQTFADYVFISSELKVNSFQVPYNHVSDHLPLILEFS